MPREVYEVLDALPGNDAATFLEQIYDSACHCAGIILLVKASIRATVATILGTFQSGAGRDQARLYLIDSSRRRLNSVFSELSKKSLAAEITVYHGSLGEFCRDLPLHPELVCTQIEDQESDGIVLRRNLPPRTDVVVFRASENGTDLDVPQGLIDAGILEPTGAGPGTLYRTTSQCQGVGFVPAVHLRIDLQSRLNQHYALDAFDSGSRYTPVADITEDVRREFSAHNPAAGGYGRWPYTVQEPIELPATLPGGKAWPKISVITATFNQGKYIEETILSVLNQGYPNLEYIIVDGASTDETPQVLDRYRERVALIISERDRGQSNAINKGMAKANGQILTWLNSDDLFAPGALAAAALAFETSGADMIAGICLMYQNGQIARQHLTSCADGPLPLDDLLDLDHGWNAGQFFYQPEVIFTRELWLRAGGHVSEELHYSMDYELWLRFAKTGANLHVIGRPLAWYRMHDEQKTYRSADFLPELRTCREGFLSEYRLSHIPVEAPPPKRYKLRITLLNDCGGLYGAGIAHVRLGRALAWAGHDVSVISMSDRPVFNSPSAQHTTQSIAGRVAASSPDLVIVGNLHLAGADPMLLHLLGDRFPTLAVLHDLWLLTGRCVYPRDCERYLTGCDATCPTPNEYPSLAPQEIADAWMKKRAILRSDSRPVLLANSHWTAAFARHLFEQPLRPGEQTPLVETFQYAFPLDMFRPRDKRACREALGLPLGRFIILLPNSLEDARKGGRPLLDAISRLDIPGLLVVVLGHPAQQVETRFDLIQLGQVDDQQRLAMLYSAADIIAAPSSAETFGQVYVEGIACGTPVAGYSVTAVREAIVDGITGVTAADFSPASLAAAIHYLYSHPAVRQDIARWGRIYVENEWSEFSAYRHFLLALRRVKLAEKLDLPRKINFLAGSPPPPPFASAWSEKLPWWPRQGFGDEEPASHLGLKTFRWAFGPEALAELPAEDRGAHRIVVAYRNPHDGQRLTLSCNNVPMGTYDLPNTGVHAGRSFSVNVALEAGVNLLHFRFSQWNRQQQPDPRPLALMITNIWKHPVGEHSDAKRMTANVWGSVAH
jgi:glycosyltransferase involved in cell wall biosynthesis